MTVKTEDAWTLTSGPHATGLDICTCGDYRTQHADGVGPCAICIHTPTPGGCSDFRLFLKATITWTPA